LHRENREEIADDAEICSLLQVLDTGTDRQYLYLARISNWSFDDRPRPEFTETGRGEYHLEVIRVFLRARSS
jgi:hypothetical protein